MVIRLKLAPEESVPTGVTPEIVPRHAPVTPRRPFVYPHRSVRAIPITRWRIAAAVLLGAMLTTLYLWQATTILNVHQNLVGALLDVTGIPTTGSKSVAIAGSLTSAPAPMIAVPTFEEVLDGPRLLLILLVALLLGLSRRAPLTRGLAYFLVALLTASAVIFAGEPLLRLESPDLTELWLRGEFSVWLLLPWLSGLLFIVTQPSPLRGAVWVLLVQAHAFLFSVARLAFCLAVMHESGMLFFPALWFTLGMLADIMGLLVFYSLSIRGTCARFWGTRQAWQS